MKKVKIKLLNKQLSHMEHQLLTAARKKIEEGHDILFIRLFLEEELATWKRDHVKYRNAPTAVATEGNAVLLRHRAANLIEFSPLL